jgi:hypothetical protein
MRPPRQIYTPPAAVYNQPLPRIAAVEVETRMSAAVICTTCQRPLVVPNDALGRLVQCPLCLDEFVAQADPKAEAAARDAAPPPPRRATPPPIPPAEETAAAATGVAEAPNEPVEVRPVEEITPVRPAARKAAPQCALVFPVMVTRDPDRVLRGRMDGELTADGLYLRKPRVPPAFAAAGARARYLGGNRLAVTVEGREIELAVVQPRTSTHHLAKDAAAFLAGKGDFPNGQAYRLPWYLYAIPFLFIALPCVAAPLGLITDGCLGAFLWTVVAVVLGGAAMAVAMQSWLKPRARLIGATSLLGVGAVLPLLAIPLTPSYTVDEALWKTYSPPDGDFSALMPGTPLATTANGNFMVEGRSQKYTVSVASPDVQFAVFVSPAPVNDPNAFQPFWNQHTKAVEDAKSLLQQEYGGYGNAYMSPQWPEPDHFENGQQWHEVTYRVSPGWNSEDRQTRTLVARVAVANGKIYTIAALGPRVRADGSDMVKFFRSMRLTGSGKTASQSPISPNELPGGGPAAYWSFDQNRVGPFPDDSGNNVTGTAHQTNIIQDGKRGGAMHFNAPNSYFDFRSADLNFGAGQGFAFCGWIRTRAAQGNVLSNHSTQSDAPLVEVLAQDGVLVAAVRQDGDAFANEASLRGRFGGDGAWHHFALVRDDAALRLYVDGLQQSEVDLFGANAAGPITTNVHALGANIAWKKKNAPAAGAFTGDIDEFCVFKRALTADEVRQLAGAAGP